MTTILRPLFPEPPGEDLIAAFRAHVRDTGEPETFPQISTTRPPDEGEIKTLFFPVNVNPKTRADRQMAPCPICSPESPKYLSGGQLIWARATKAIYAIGPRCASGYLGRATQLSLREFQRVDRERRNAARLLAAAKVAPLARAWAMGVRDLAGRVEGLHGGFAKDMRQLRAALNNALKSSVTHGATRPDGSHIGVVEGLEFLRGGWRLLAALNAADDILSALERAAGADAEAWVDALAPSAVEARLEDVDAALKKHRAVFDRLEEAHRFFTDKTLRVLGEWGASGGAPMDFRAERTGSRVIFRTASSMWSGPVGLAAPNPLPDALPKAR